MGNRGKKYVVYNEPNNQEVIIAFTDKEAMAKALKMFNIKITRLSEGLGDKKIIN